MGKHSASDHPQEGTGQPGEVTLDRVTAALTSLGLDAVETVSHPDRIVVPAYAFVATLWISYDKPLMLVADFAERIPTDFAHSTSLAMFINEWNRDKVGPTASFSLMDSGDVGVSLRYGVRIRCGLTDDQIMAELADAFEHAAAFSTQLREKFLPVEFDQPLPPALARAQDAEALLGRHPAERHLPRGEHREFADIHDVPDLYQERDCDPVEPVDLEALADSLEMLDFTFSLATEDIITTGVNGIAFAVCIDAGHYARVTAMWDTGTDADEGFLPLWLVCNDLNEQSAGLRAYILDNDGDLHLHVETTCLASEGLSPDQRHNYVITSFVSILGAVDHITTQMKGDSAVRWPGAGES
ncbi:YbjN domain-containing protein [Corynebacterium qintianiae]|uniref:YbjN domain-containing protein n=1 Tax=Corynebacterium qintianiae TaxID=2709392 RepID=A0A7T0KLH7_9CORY|nr:YbjN domain-containing protein [Corynebacterium qintianiae]QPK82649.1 YbjN domain-containing protein [Corynebacterium qintianiae]